MSEQTKKIALFDFVSDINEHKHYLFSEDTKTAYVPYMVNKALSQHIDTIMLANEMNKRPNLSKSLQHDFLFYSVAAGKRYGKWAKKVENFDVEVINYLKRKYTIGTERAEQYYEFLTDEEINVIKRKIKTLRGKV